MSNLETIINLAAEHAMAEHGITGGSHSNPVSSIAWASVRSYMTARAALISMAKHAIDLYDRQLEAEEETPKSGDLDQFFTLDQLMREATGHIGQVVALSWQLAGESSPLELAVGKLQAVIHNVHRSHSTVTFCLEGAPHIVLDDATIGHYTLERVS